jgi:hypothetical protein
LVVIVYASHDVPLAYLLTLFWAAYQEDVRINRFHFGVQDPSTRKEGTLSYYLPTRLDFNAGPDLDYEGDWLRIGLVQGTYGAEYSMADLENPEGEWVFEALEDLHEPIETLRAGSPEMEILLVLQGISEEEAIPGNEPLSVKHFIDLLTFLKKRNADLKWERFDAMMLKK